MKKYISTVLSFLLCCLGTYAHAQDSASILAQEYIVAEGESIEENALRFEMMVVYATDVNNAIDPQVRPLMKYFRNYKFTGFSLLDSQNGKLVDNSAKTFLIEGDRKITVSLLSHTDTAAKLKVVIIENKDQKILDTTISINRNGTFIVAGPKYKDGILFLPFSVKY